MKVVCDNCRAVYKVPDAKLVKAVNKATCRNCGHRMLIPRPKPGADPDERTLVTAVPPTPVGAPPRTGGQLDSHSLPRSTGAPPSARSLPPSALDWEEGPDTAVVDGPTVQDPGRGRTPPPARSGIRHTPAPMSRPSTGVISRGSTPAPIPGRTNSSARNAYQAAAIHDPANDMNWAILGTGFSLFGAFFLALLSVFNHPLLMWFGLALAFGGGVLTFLVLLTGSRGRRPAKSLLSVLLGFMVAVVMASTMVGTKWGAEKVISELDINFSSASLNNAVSEPAAALPVDIPGQGSVAMTTNDGTADEGLQPSAPAPSSTAATPRPPPAAAPPAPVRPQPARPDPAPASPAVPRPPPAPVRPDPVPAAPAPPPPAAPEPPAPQQAPGVPIEAVHVMLSNNLAVKRCFVPLYRAGTLPAKVEVRFNILPSGSAANAQILSPAAHMGGSDLEVCLAGAIGGIQFPQTSGKGTLITYPFILQ